MNEKLCQELCRLHTLACGAGDSPANPYVFPNPKTGEPYKNRRWQIKQACEAGGVPNYGWHAIRHLVLSLLAAGGMDLTTIQRYSGHMSVHTTAGYIQSVTEDARVASKFLSTESPANIPANGKKEGVNRNG